MKSRYNDLNKALNDFQSDVLSLEKKALTAMTNTFVKRTIPFVPKGKTNQLRTSIVNNSEYDKGLARAKTPYAEYINNGISKSGKPLNYTEPGTGEKYFEKSFEKNKDEVKQEYVDTINKNL